MPITGQSPLFAPPSITEKRFVNALRGGKSPAADEGGSIYRRLVNNGFDPLIALAQFQAESGLGTKGHAVTTLNWGNILFYPWTAELGAVTTPPSMSGGAPARPTSPPQVRFPISLPTPARRK